MVWLREAERAALLAGENGRQVCALQRLADAGQHAWAGAEEATQVRDVVRTERVAHCGQCQQRSGSAAELGRLRHREDAGLLGGLAHPRGTFLAAQRGIVAQRRQHVSGQRIHAVAQGGDFGGELFWHGVVLWVVFSKTMPAEWPAPLPWRIAARSSASRSRARIRAVRCGESTPRCLPRRER